MHHIPWYCHNQNVYLRERFLGLIKKFCNDRSLWESKFQILVNHYESQTRFHHNLQHLQEMFEFLDRYKNKIQDFDAVEFAVWLHDIVYNTSSQKHWENERISSELASQMMRELQVPQTIIWKTQHLIIATINHELIEWPSDKRDVWYFLDSDMSVLWSSPERYAKYAWDIRKEYLEWTKGKVPEEIFNQLYTQWRKDFLTSTLQKWVFINSDVEDILWESSRANMEWEIEQLS